MYVPYFTGKGKIKEIKWQMVSTRFIWKLFDAEECNEMKDERQEAVWISLWSFAKSIW